MPMLIGQFVSKGRQELQFYRTLQQSIEIRVKARLLLASLQDAEAAQRSFLLTAGQHYFDQYARAVREVPDHLQALKVGLDGTALEPLIRRLEEYVPAATSELALAIRIFQQSGPAAAVKFIADAGEKTPMEEARGALVQILSVERRNAEELWAEVREQAESTRSTILILLGGITLMILGTGGAGLVYFAHRYKTERILQEAWHVAETAQQEADKANHAKTEFLTTMSHEIRTPLHSIIGSSEILLDGHGLTSEHREYLDRIQLSSTALLNLVNDVLDLAKIEAGEGEIYAAPFSTETLIDNSVSIVGTTAARKGLKLTTSLDHRLPLMLLGDEARLRQILLNLLGNAVKFTEQGEVTLRVERQESTATGETLRFSVTDTGPGIPARRRDRLFRRFSQISQSARQSGGTGLGLAISKQLVELMGGQMGFESEEGHGSTFWFSLTLPQVDDDVSPHAEADWTSLPSDRMDHELSGRILVVDDLDQNRDLARKMLEMAGYDVDLAPNGTEAVAAVQSRNYDVVLMDIQMDDMDGVAATKVIRDLDRPAKHVPIIAMTANVLTHDVKSYKAAGMNDHLGKPFKRKQLLEKVRQWVPAASSIYLPKDESIVPQIPGGSSDQKTIDVLCSTLGRDWVSKGLTELVDQLELTVTDLSADIVDREVLARRAHLLVSRAGIFGFSDMAQVCRLLEEACKTGRTLGPFSSKLQTAAHVARSTALQFLQMPNVAPLDQPPRS